MEILVNLKDEIGVIRPEIYGHFCEHLGECIYGGIWVGENSKIPNIAGIRKDVVEALKRVKVSVFRWPGGCFADCYHWQDGIGPKKERPKRVNYHWGKVIETNEFGTHEFIQFCKLIGASPYICGNVGTGSPKELRDWIEYCNFEGESTLSLLRKQNGSESPFNVKYWGIGNENWGCGGHFTPEDYASEYRRFSTFAFEFGQKISLIACGPGGNDLQWTEKFFKKITEPGNYINRINGYACHYYCGTAGTATEYSTDEWYQLLKKAIYMEKLIQDQRNLMDYFDPERKIELIIDEWGTWHRPAPGRNPSFLWQQNTLRDAMVAALTLDILNRNADKVGMANIAQTVNVLQSLILTFEDKIVLTPTYYVYQLYQKHQGGCSLKLFFDSPTVQFKTDNGMDSLRTLSGSASLKDKKIFLTLTNSHTEMEDEIKVSLHGEVKIKGVSGKIITHPDFKAYNTTEEEKVKIDDFEVKVVADKEIIFHLLPKSIYGLEISLR